MGSKTKNIFPIFLSGYPCGFRCAYCNSKAVSGVSEKIGQVDLINKIDQAIQMQNKNDNLEVAFYGNDFSSLPENLRDEIFRIGEYYFRKGRLSGIRLDLRPDTVFCLDKYNTEIIKTVEIGVPTLDDTILDKIGRLHSAHDVAKAMRYLNAKNLTVIVQTMIGLPGAGMVEAEFTARTLCKFKPFGVRIHPTLILKGTQLEGSFFRGEWQPLTLDQAISICVKLVRIYTDNNIKITRMGLYIPQELLCSSLVAGPYHQNFGTLVRSEEAFMRLSEILSLHRNVTELQIPTKYYSYYIGYKSQNITRIKLLYGNISFVANPLIDEVLVIERLEDM